MMVKTKPMKINRIKLKESRSERGSIFLEARIKENGDLQLEGQDIGPLVEEMWGDSDYEYWLTVDKDYKDTVLLRLIKERFSRETEFKKWLEEKQIPFNFMTYA